METLGIVLFVSLSLSPCGYGSRPARTSVLPSLRLSPNKLNPTKTKPRRNESDCRGDSMRFVQGAPYIHDIVTRRETITNSFFASRVLLHLSLRDSDLDD